MTPSFQLRKNEIKVRGVPMRRHHLHAYRCITMILALSFSLLLPVEQARAEAMHEFIISSTYGALAGGLVGAASLAFSDRPGDNLNRVARGTSLGLYAGMLLGLYVIYGVPSEKDDPSSAGLVRIEPGARFTAAVHTPRWVLLPMIERHGIEGLSAQVSLLNF
jgi:hypothetical protein